MQEALVRNLAAFSRFLQAASFSQASTLNVSDVARDSHVERKVVENYFSILEDLLLAVRIPIFSKRAKRDLITHRKFLYYDVGVYRTIRPRGPLDSQDEIDGAALETLFYQLLRANNDYLKKEYEIYYWRTRGQIELDFVLYGPRGLLAFEIKRNRNIAHKDLRALNEFGKDYPEAKLFLIYGGEDERLEHGIRILPYAIAIQQLPELI